MNVRFYATMACYAVLAALATWTLEGKMRTAVYIFLGGLALKTWLVVARGEQ
jgi:hypothetical protein